jgi:hypothetical protein
MTERQKGNFKKSYLFLARQAELKRGLQKDGGNKKSRLEEFEVLS